MPFGYVDGVSGEGGDLRYTHTANRATSRHDIVDRGGGIDGPSAILRQMLDTVFSGTYRTDAAERRGVLSDFYSPALQPGSIHPGSIVYDVNGHVGIVWKVDADGRIYYMDAHPDFTITRSVYGAQFGQSPLRLGGGLKNWRPFKLVGAKHDRPAICSAAISPMPRTTRSPTSRWSNMSARCPIPKMDVTKARFFYNGQELGFYEYVRVAVSGGRMDFNPVYELKATMTTLCNDLNDRAQYVDLDIKDGIAVKPHPERLPDNIYGSENLEWETYSTPSRDARIKAAFVQFYKDMSDMIDMWVKRDPRIVYDGNFLKDDLARAYAEAVPGLHHHLSEFLQAAGGDDVRRHDAPAVHDLVRSLSLRRAALGRAGDEARELHRRQGQAALVRGRAAPAQPARPDLRHLDMAFSCRRPEPACRRQRRSTTRRPSTSRR